jgi:hypothetical protein
LIQYQIRSWSGLCGKAARIRDRFMRIRVCSFASLTLASLGLAFTASAQKFQEPTKEELQMTLDPKAPGAPAVFLYREETMDNSSHFVSSYARIKVLTELGKEWATVEIPHFAVLNGAPIIQGRTIHSDGSVIPLRGNASDLLVVKDRGEHLKATVFNLPSVEVGSILEYRWTVPMTGTRYEDEGDRSEGFYASASASEMPDWDVQETIFVHKAHFYYNPHGIFGGGGLTLSRTSSGFLEGNRLGVLVYAERLPAGSKVIQGQRGDYALDIQDVPAIHREANAPPLESYRYGVDFYLTAYSVPNLFWSNEGARWPKNLDQFAGPSDALKTAASQIVASTDTPEVKARKLYDAVQALENTDFTRAKSEAERQQLHRRHELKKAGDVWAEKTGSGDDIATLYLALARAAGLQADGLKVADRNRRIFDPNYLTLNQLDTLLVVVHIDGKDIYLDPGEKFCPFGQLQWTHVLAGGLEENSKAPVYTPPNLSKDAITAHAADLTLDAHGGVTGTVKIIMNGPAALKWRQLNLTTDPDEVKRQFNESLQGILPQGISGVVTGFEGMDTSAGYVTAAVRVSGQLGSATGKRLLMPGFFFSAGAHAQFVAEEKRDAAVDLHYAEQVIDDTVYHLPDGFAVESAPQPTQLPWPDHAALVVRTAPGAGVIDIKHIFARTFVLLDAKEYPALRDYYQKIAISDQQQLVLVPAGGAAGSN